MDDALEHPDDGLRDRIRIGFEESKRSSKSIDERLKTPRANTKTKQVAEVSESVSDNKKGGAEKKCAKARKTPEKKQDDIKNVKVASPKTVNVDAVYLCPLCDKTYKSKNGILKHMSTCK